MRIPLIKPYIDYTVVENDFRKVFESGMFTRGDNVKALQEEISAFTGAKHTFLTTSATTALWVCLKLLGIGPGDEVIVSDFSFPASSNVVEDLGAVPVFADVSLETYNMLPEQLQSKITEKTKAVIFVDALGNPSGLTEIQEICRAHGIPLIEDAACAIGSSENGVRCGNIADITCFSFHPRKLLCTGEGGAITTNNDEWAEWLSVKLMHGAKGMQGMALDFPTFGYNFRLPELQAVMGRHQLPMLSGIIEERRAIREQYIKKLEPLGFKAQGSANSGYHNMQSVVFTVPDTVDRDSLIRYLKERDIETSIGTYALSSISYNANKYKSVQPNAQKLYETTITVPCYKGVDVDLVCGEIAGYDQLHQSEKLKA